MISCDLERTSISSTDEPNEELRLFGAEMMYSLCLGAESFQKGFIGCWPTVFGCCSWDDVVKVFIPFWWQS